MNSDRSPSPALRWAGALVAGLALAAATAAALVQLLAPSGSDLGTAFRTLPVATVGAILSPLVAAVVVALIAVAAGSGRAAVKDRGPAIAAAPADRSAAARASSPAAALQLLALLQQEGRFVDFIQEDLTGYADEQIGAAVRSIHEGCRSALRDRLELVPILAGAEGSTVTVERGFDPSAVRLSGDVRGEPPYRGVLRHPGWRSQGFRLPERTGEQDLTILAPAEVEIA